jgi:aspartyl/glutamyl-tRNA(Asn/Gln) amidotransferase C subunit
MTFDRDHLLRLAELVKINLYPDEIPTLLKDLSSFLTYCDILKKLPDEELDLAVEVQATSPALREDIELPSLTVEAIASMAGPAFDVRRRLFVFQGVLDRSAEHQAGSAEVTGVPS